MLRLVETALSAFIKERGSLHEQSEESEGHVMVAGSARYISLTHQNNLISVAMEVGEIAEADFEDFFAAIAHLDASQNFGHRILCQGGVIFWLFDMPVLLESLPQLLNLMFRAAEREVPLIDQLLSSFAAKLPRPRIQTMRGKILPSVH